MKTKQAKNFEPEKSKAIRIIASNIRHFRLKLNISQEYLAELSNTHRNFIGMIERCNSNINVIHLELIAKALKISLSDLVSKHPEVDYRLPKTIKSTDI